MARIYLGYGITNNQGVATLDHDANGNTLSNSYTGVGTGELDIVAESGTLQSEIFAIIDSLFYDKGLTGTGQHNDNWSNLNNRMTITRETDGTLLTSTSDWGQLYVISQSTYFECDFCIEFDVLSISDTPAIRFRNSSNTSATHNLQEGHYKIEWKSDSIKVLLDGVEQTHYISSLVGSDVNVYFEHSNTTDVLKYRNFVIYPI